MDQLSSIIMQIREFLSFKIWHTDTVDIAADTLNAIVVSFNLLINDNYGDPLLKSAIRHKIDADFGKHNSGIPFPQRYVFLFSQNLS
ncbi:hypothetical protein KCTC52924_02414 [Arenibacter antarcticus]|uniref:Uncharacterized protein n=1 Tax=Arenibacter antarcticus TaxID=2040469 RepID=A0ABW5VJJ9_9FLAO|nr:hypothetical protein [Arenibacter sp. H213]MCM4168722.1 hypothetical protein [Arenibacter sp. H213]